MKILFILIILSISCNKSDCEKVFLRNPVRLIDEDCMLQNLESLKLKYSFDKKIPKQCELPALIALSYYPELHDTSIEFKYSDIKTTMETRPKSISAIRGSNRTYIIFIDNKVDNNYGILLNDVPFNAQIGLIGHELAHIADYKEKSSRELITFGIEYISDRKADIEKQTDRYTIKKGLGWQLKDWSNFVLNLSNANQAYKDYKKENYLTPKEINAEISKLDIYQ